MNMEILIGIKRWTMKDKIEIAKLNKKILDLESKVSILRKKLNIKKRKNRARKTYI